MGVAVFLSHWSKIYQFKVEDSSIKPYLLSLGNKPNGYLFDFSIECNAINFSNIQDIHIYLMKKHDRI